MTADKDPDLVRHEMLMANYARNDPALANMWNWTDKDGWATGHALGRSLSLQIWTFSP